MHTNFGSYLISYLWQEQSRHSKAGRYEFSSLSEILVYGPVPRDGPFKENSLSLALQKISHFPGGRFTFAALSPAPNFADSQPLLNQSNLNQY